MGRHAVIYNFFSNEKKCNKCKKQFSQKSSNTTLVSHLKSAHPSLHRLYQELQSKANAVESKQEEAAKPSSPDSTGSSSPVIAKKTKTDDIRALFHKVRVADVATSTANLFAHHSLPHALVESPKFAEFVASVRANPAAKLPNRKTLRAAVLTSADATQLQTVAFMAAQHDHVG